MSPLPEKKEITGGILNKEDKQMHNKAMIIQINCLKKSI